MSYSKIFPERLPEDPTLDSETAGFRRPKSWIRAISVNVLIWSSRILLLSLILYGLMHLSNDIAQYSRSSRSCSCGTSVRDALSRQCRFDPISAAWLPPHCRDDELIDEFNRAGPNPDGSWNYYADTNKTRTMSLEEVGYLAEQRPGLFYATHSWHIKHCTYNWRKQWRQDMTGVVLEMRSKGYGHIPHCEEMFLIRAGLEDVVASSGVEINADRP